MTASIIVIADAGPLIALSRIDHLSLLPALFDHVVMTETVRQEVLRGGLFDDARHVRAALEAGWLSTVADPVPAAPGTMPFPDLDAGELTSINWALQQRSAGLASPVLILDDALARRAARACRLELVGTVGVILLAKTAGLIPQVHPLLTAMRSGGYFISQTVIDNALRMAGEHPPAPA